MKDPKAAARYQIQQAVEHLDHGRFEPAVRMLERLHRDQPDDVDVLRVLTRALCEARLQPQLDQILRQAMQRKGQTPELLSFYAQLQSSVGKFDAALETQKAAARLAPESPDVLIRLGNAFLTLRRTNEAYTAFERAERHGGDPYETNLGLAQVFTSLGSVDDAHVYFERALAARPDSSAVLCHLGMSLRIQGRYPEALEYYQRAVAAAPHRTNPVLGLAAMLGVMGSTEEAAAQLRRVIDSGRTDGEVALIAARIGRKGVPPQETLRLIDQALARPQEPPATRQNLFFARGSLLEKAGEFDHAFAAYKAANDVGAATTPFEQFRRVFADIESVFTADKTRSFYRCRNRDPRPVFILGMPRSGTSLIEQILSMHPAITAGGELHYIGQIASSATLEMGGRLYPSFVRDVSPEQWERWAASDLQRMERMSQGRPILTDKLPHNFLYLGLISRLYPAARVIHCLRDPVDNCLSIYATNLNMGHGYRHKLSWLGEYYQRYRRLMDHWRSVLELPILDVVYEDTVADVEAQTRRVLDFLGLPWEPACLKYYESDRITLTASMDQVRRPIYKSSVNRADRFGSHLDELREALGPFGRPLAPTTPASGSAGT